MKKINFIFLFLGIIFFISCNKAKKLNDVHSSVKILPCDVGYNIVRMVKGNNENILIAISQGTAFQSLKQQMFHYIKPNGDLIKTFRLSDTSFCYIEVVPGIDGGFLVLASSEQFINLKLFKIDDNCNIEWTKKITTLNSINNEPYLTISSDNNYLVQYSLFSWGNECYLEKYNVSGKYVSKRQVPWNYHTPTPNSVDQNCLRILPFADTLSIMAGYADENASKGQMHDIYVRGLKQNFSHKWYSDFLDTSTNENFTGLEISSDKKIILFGMKFQGSANSIYVFGTPFARQYSVKGKFEKEIIYDNIGLMLTNFYQSIPSPDGGFLLVGTTNFPGRNDITLDTKIILMKLNSDLSVAWTKTPDTYFTTTGFAVSYLGDGTIALTGIVRERNVDDKVVFMHTDASGNIIKN